MRRQTKFTRTCSLLRRYIREKGGGTAAARLLGTVPMHDTPDLNGNTALLPDLNDSANIPHRGQMTIFYAGKVVVFDDFPAHKAKQVMDAVAVRSGEVHRSVPAVPSSTTTRPPVPGWVPHSTQAGGGGPLLTGSQDRPDDNTVLGSDLPIARRVSLNRFLEKRKDRITSKAPYHLIGSEFLQDGYRASATAAVAATEREKRSTPVPDNEDNSVNPPTWLVLAPPSMQTD